MAEKTLLYMVMFTLIFLLLGCPREKYAGEYYPSNISGPVNVYKATLVAKLSVFDEEQKLYYATFRPVPLKYPYEKVFVLKDVRNLKEIYGSMKDYVPPAVKEDNLFVRVGDEVKDYKFLFDKSAILFTLGEVKSDVDYSVEATNINNKVYVTVNYSLKPSESKTYPYILVLFDNAVKEDIEVKINKLN